MPYNRSRFLLLVGAAVSFVGAAVLILGAGLPQRVTYTAYEVPGDSSAPAAPEVGAVAPPIALQSASGETVRLADLRGEPVVVNFWATWCAPCRVEMPELQALADAYGDAGLHVLGINGGESRQAVRRWRDALGLDFPLLLDQDEVVARRYALRGYPSTFVIAPDGVIQQVYYGPVTQAQLERALLDYLPVDDA